MKLEINKLHMINDTTFIFGDVQGQHQLLKTLLYNEALLDLDNNRLNPEIKVISLGDLGHFAGYSMGSQKISPEDDEKCFQLLFDNIVDIMLWGNHDRPIMGHLGSYTFSGFRWPSDELTDKIRQARKNGQIKLAYAIDEFLLTHAGLHSAWGNNDITKQILTAEEIADSFNEWDDLLFGPDSYNIGRQGNTILGPFVDTIGRVRGGLNKFGGIMWRDDDDEPLYDGARQIYGHTAHQTIQTHTTKLGDSYCLDISKSDSIAAIWLPSETVVTVNQNDMNYFNL